MWVCFAQACEHFKIFHCTLYKNLKIYTVELSVEDEKQLMIKKNDLSIYLAEPGGNAKQEHRHYMNACGAHAHTHTQYPS